MERRRLEDARPRVLTLLLEKDSTTPGTLSPAGDGGDRHAGAAAYLIDSATGELLILGVERSITVPRGTSPSDLARRVDLLTSSWYREHLRTSRMAQRFRALLLLGERLSRADSITELRAAAEEHVAGIVGGAAALVLESSDAGLAAREGPFLVRREDVETADGAAVGCTREAFERSGAASLACAGLGGCALLAIVERRSESWIEPEAWYRLRAVASQLAAARARIQPS